MLSTTNTEQLLSANRANVESALNVAQLTLDGVERTLAFNLSAWKSAVTESANVARALLEAKDPQEWLKMQTEANQPLGDRVLAYSRGAYEIAAQTGAQVSKLFEAQVAEFNKQAIAFLDGAAKNGVPGTEVAINSVKSAIAAANAAFESATKVGQEVAHMAEANVQAATQATTKAINGARRKGA